MKADCGKRGRHRIALLAAICLLLPTFTIAQAGNAPYDTRTAFSLGGATKTKDSYLPIRTMEKFGDTQLNNPSDIAISKEDVLYIADTMNARILKVSASGEYLGEFGKDVLKQPKGVFVNDRLEVYVADPRQKAVFLFDPQGQLMHTYTKPTDAYYGSNVDFSPSKVVADRSGNVYIIAEGNTSGIIQLSKEGDFFGYVGANKTPLTLAEIIRRITSTGDQQAQMKLNVPVSPINLAIDRRGLVYTVTQGGIDDALKKFNMAGVNMFKEAYVDALVAAVCISSMGNIYTVSTDGYVAEYTSEGHFLYLFAGRDDGYNRNGLFVAATGIATDSQGQLYVLDATRKSVTVFKPTEYAQTVHTALDLYEKGRYVESREPWESALRQDALFFLAYRGIGEAYYKLGMYGEAKDAFYRGFQYRGYSDSFWEIRNAWLMQHLSTIFLAMIALLFLVQIVKVTNRRYGYLRPVAAGMHQVADLRVIRQVSFMSKLPRNPADAFYGIRHEGKVSLLSSTIVYLLFFLVFLLDKYAKAFLFKTIAPGFYEIGRDAALVFGVLALTVVCVNLICSISDGEGRMRDVYCSFAYCLMPYIYIKPILVLVSHGLTQNEAFIMTFGDVFIFASMAVLIVVMVKEIQAYTYKQTFRCLFLALFTMAMIVVTGVIIFILVSQVVDFVSSIVREVYFRAQ